MRPKTSFELFRWTYYFLFWFIGMGVSVVIIELAVGPALQWLFHDTSYQLPTWNRAGRMAVFVVLFSFFAGTVTWFSEKKRTGR
ncbi:hypothetical protein PHO31112_02257 [Pandoraea horticolens]|uniref:Uncharacterized protein n=1 Tax=Pandoraea horticolens TaxID=2508298 RepID=A0A5E4UVA7_9BURK|nr:hypothetical protein PHO31112_02257 [Pandoraea horticolens]